MEGTFVVLFSLLLYMSEILHDNTFFKLKMKGLSHQLQFCGEHGPVARRFPETVTLGWPVTAEGLQLCPP